MGMLTRYQLNTVPAHPDKRTNDQFPCHRTNFSYNPTFMYVPPSVEQVVNGLQQ